jgi:hypothetical protein
MTKLDSLGRTRPPIQCSDAPTFSFNVFGSDGSKQLAALYGPTSAPAFSPNHLRRLQLLCAGNLGRYLGIHWATWSTSQRDCNADK